MKLIFALLFIMTFSAQAQSICSRTEGKDVYWKLKAMPIQDKSMHCTLSCHLTLKCGALEAWGAGMAKEFMDVFGAGNAEMADLRANTAGRRLAYKGQATNPNQCLSKCKALYEPK